jgi:hypothetical protein
MNLRTLMVLGFAGFIASPALAQTPPAAAPAAGPPTTTQVSTDSLLAAGYEVKAVTVVTDTALKEMYPGKTTPAQLLITFQKGNSVAVCQTATASWDNISDATMTNATLCSKR